MVLRIEAQVLADQKRLEQQPGAPDLSATLHYIRERQTPAGGFSDNGAWGVEEPGAAETCHAVSILTALGSAPKRRKDCLRWLQDCQNAQGGYPGIATAWHVTDALSRLASTPRRSPAEWLASYSEHLFDGLDGEALESGELLLDMARYVELLKRFKCELESHQRAAIEAHLKRLRDANGAFPRDAANLVDSAIALRLIHAAGLLADRGLLDFALACQDSLYGFHAVAQGRSTHLAVLAAGVAIMHEFNATPGYPRALLDTVMACRHVSGGFGRHIGALATLRDTSLAVYLINNIKVIT